MDNRLVYEAVGNVWVTCGQLVCPWVIHALSMAECRLSIYPQPLSEPTHIIHIFPLQTDAYPYTYPISSRRVCALTFLHSVLWIKARGRLVLNCCLIGLMEVTSLSPRHYRLLYCQAAALSCSLRTYPNTLSGS